MTVGWGVRTLLACLSFAREIARRCEYSLCISDRFGLIVSENMNQLGCPYRLFSLTRQPSDLWVLREVGDGIFEEAQTSSVAPTSQQRQGDRGQLNLLVHFEERVNYGMYVPDMSRYPMIGCILDQVELAARSNRLALGSGITHSYS
jgi:hypothetical protein